MKKEDGVLDALFSVGLKGGLKLVSKTFDFRNFVYTNLTSTFSTNYSQTICLILKVLMQFSLDKCII